jgi:hypothetical protein
MSDRVRAIERLKETCDLLEEAEQRIVGAYKDAPKSRGCYAEATEFVSGVVGEPIPGRNVLSELRSEIALWLGELEHTYAEERPARGGVRA